MAIPPSDLPRVAAGLRPVSASLLTLDDFDLLGIPNLAGAGACSGTVQYIDYVNDWTDSAIVRFGVPEELRHATINGFKYTVTGFRVNVNTTDTVFVEVSAIDGAGLRCGCREDILPETTGAADITIEQDLPSTAINKARTHGGPDGITLFSGGSNYFSGGNDTRHPNQHPYTDQAIVNTGSRTRHLGTRAQTMDDFGGLTFRVRAKDHGGSPKYMFWADSMTLDVYYTPAPAAGHRVVQMRAGEVATSNWSAYGLSAPGEEGAWAGVTSMLAGDGSIATCGVGDCSGMFSPPPGTAPAVTGGTSAAVEFTLPRGQLGRRSNGSPRELRFWWKGRVEAFADERAIPDFARLHDVVLADAAGATLVDTDKLLYGVSSFKIGSYGWNTENVGAAARLRDGERWRVACLDIRGLTAAQVNAIQQQGCRVVARWKFTNEQKAEDVVSYCAVAISAVRFEMVFDPASMPA